MVSGVEVPSWVGRDLRVGCVVVCGRERERGGEEGREEEERKGKDFSLFYSSNPLKPLRSIPAGLTPCGASRRPSYHFPYTPLSHLPILHRPKSGGSPPSSPSGEREEKGGEKEDSGSLQTSIFLSGGEPPDPPTLLGRARKRQEKRGRALC